jgi:starch phosphorylase
LIRACVWQIKIGKIKLLLMDHQSSGNPKVIRDITSRLYDSQGERRAAQEVLLGIGGVKLLTSMELFPPSVI